MKWSELDDEELLTTPKLAEWTKLSASWYEKARMKDGKGPRFMKLEGAVRYRVGDVNQWIEENMRKSNRTGYAYDFSDDLPPPEDIIEWLNE